MICVYMHIEMGCPPVLGSNSTGMKKKRTDRLYKQCDFCSVARKVFSFVWFIVKLYQIID